MNWRWASGSATGTSMASTELERPTAWEPKGAVYVGAGIGASVIPLRLGERGRREVAVFELGALPGTIMEDLEEQAPLPGRPPTPEQRRKRAAKVLQKAARRARRAAWQR